MTYEPTILYGAWVHQGVRYEDELVRLYVECEDSRTNERFVRSLKEAIQEQFKQLEIRVTALRIRIL